MRRVVASVWGEDDYVLDVLPRWSRDRRGGLWLASLDGRAVGFGKLTLLGDREAWIHGLRVAPEARKQGVGTALLRHRLERARKLGARVARLDTGDENTAVLRMARRAGMRRVAAFTSWSSSARAGPRPIRARLPQLPSIWRIVRSASARGPVFGPAPRERHLLDRVALRRSIREGLCLVAGDPPAALALVSASAKSDRKPSSASRKRRPWHADRLLVQTLAGRPAALRDLLRKLPAEAAARGLRAVVVSAAPSMARTLRAAGYRRRWPGRMVVLERRF